MVVEDQVRLMPSGNWEPDPLVLDERFMLAHIRGKGLVIFTGCSHAGAVNICRHAQELFPATPLYALVGGLHLVYPNERRSHRRDYRRIKEVQFKRDCTRALHGLAGGPCICQSIWREDGRSFSSWYAPVLVGLNPAKPEISAKQHPGNSVTRSNGTNYAPLSPFSAQIWFGRCSQEVGTNAGSG
jgi:hypothetical protein